MYTLKSILLSPYFTYSVVKEALRSSTGSLTEKHIEDVSMCALFLLEAAKKTDKEFGCHQTSSHTVREADSDIRKLVQHLLEKKVIIKLDDRKIPAFNNPSSAGYKKLCTTSWVQETLSKIVTDDVWRKRKYKLP